jgi:hypothetical protein
MYNSDTEVLFPSRVIPSLRDLHGEEWSTLVEHISSAKATPAERDAFVLMMVRMCGCVACNADSFRAMRGCSQCSRQTARRFRGGDHEIVEQYRQAYNEVEAYLQKKSSPAAEDESASSEEK